MNTLQLIQDKIRPNAKGGLGSRNYNTFSTSAIIAQGEIWCIFLPYIVIYFNKKT